ncbi:MAG: 3-oxoacyl-ACP reductase FabG [Ruminococcus sp.]|jgi:3-oxoacyl-[acyl-carrier protein] reductase|nr:3-oxoacyl-ACP reductase FabG [Ruminococcus sp.]
MTAIITGASRGIGAAIAETFAENDINVIINFLSHEWEAKALRDKLNTKAGKNIAEICKSDVSNPEDVLRLKNFCNEIFGECDILINNAGISLQKLITQTTTDEWDRLFDVNVKGVYLMTNAVLPEMINRKSGVIINISSVWGISGASCEVAYSASKASVIGFTKALSRELGPSGIRVNCIAPGVIDTPMTQVHSPETLADLCGETPLCRIGKPFDIAEAALYLAKADFMTGQVLTVDGGII